MSDDLTPGERSLRASIAANVGWSECKDRSARTRPGRAAFLARFEKEVDPSNELPPEERAKRAANARSAYFKRLALKSAKARRRAASRASDGTEPGTVAS